MARGHIRKRGNNSWLIAISAGVDPAIGTRRRIWRTIRGTKRAALAEMTRIQAEYDRGVVPVRGKITVAEWLAQWLSDIVAQRNAPRTVQSYTTVCRKHIIPELGHLPLLRLEPSHVDRLMRAVLDKGRTANTAHHVFTVLRKAVADAERRGMIDRNPCRLTSPPRKEPYRVEQPSIEAVKAIIAEAESDLTYGAAIDFMARTGIRRGEAVALRWRNIDLDRGTALIEESAQRIDGRGVQITSTKSAAGRRTLPLDAQTVLLLRRWRAEQDQHALRVGPAFEDQGFVFTRRDGRPFNPDHLTRAFKRHARKVGHPKLRLHDLRHFHAFGLITVGAHPKVIQDRLGHSSAAFSMQVYGHGSEGLQREAAERFAAMLGN